jgi:hypothetical protein
VNDIRKSTGGNAVLASLWKFFLHILVATILFGLISFAGVGLSFYVALLEEHETSLFIVYGLKLAEYFIFVIDLILFVIFVLRTSWSFIKGLW